VVTKCALENYNKDRDVEASESNGKDSGEDNGENNSEDNDKNNKKDEEFQDKIDIDLDKLVKTLYYKHITLILLQKPKAKRDFFAMEIDLRFTKGHKQKYKQ